MYYFNRAKYWWVQVWDMSIVCYKGSRWKMPKVEWNTVLVVDMGKIIVAFGFIRK